MLFLLVFLLITYCSYSQLKENLQRITKGPQTSESNFCTKQAG